MRPPRPFVPAVLFVLVAPFALLAGAATAQQLGFEAAAQFSARNSGLAVVVWDDDEIVFEQYHNGHGADKPQHLFSGTKSFVPIVALIAQREGLLEIDEKVVDTITEWKQGDPQRRQITIRHLLNFTSGLENNDATLHTPKAPDKYAASVACKCATRPGKRFRYGSNHLMVFGELLKRKLAAASTEQKPLPVDFVAYLEARVLEPIGCKFQHWSRDGAGNPALPYGAHMTAREWGKFGVLLANGGKWGDAQIVPPKHLDDCYVGTKANPIYGLNFWLTGKNHHKRDRAIPADTVAAAGMWGQKLYVIPSRKLTIVRLAKTGGQRGFNDLEFLGALFGPDDGK